MSNLVTVNLTHYQDMPLGVRPVNGRYYVRPVNESMRRVFARAFPGKKSAPLGTDKAEMRKRWVELFCAPDNAPPAAGTVAEILDRFDTDELPRINPKTGRPLYAPSTQQNYRGSIKRLREEFGARKYGKTVDQAVAGNFLRALDIDAYLRKHEKKRPAAANQDIVCLTTAFRCAKRWGLAEYNPCIGVEYNQNVPRTVNPSDELFMQVYRAAKPVLQCMMDLAQMLGPRRGSIAALTLADIRAEGLRVVANKTKRGHVPKETIYEWSDDLRATVDRAKALRAKRRGSGRVESIHLFLTNRGGPYGNSALTSLWERALKRAGVDRAAFHFHDIRAKSGTDSANDLDAMKRLGHADLRTTRKVYRRKPDVVAPLPAVSRKDATATGSGKEFGNSLPNTKNLATRDSRK